MFYNKNTIFLKDTIFTKKIQFFTKKFFKLGQIRRYQNGAIWCDKPASGAVLHQPHQNLVPGG